jgi:glucose-1-phosphate cytidylyltransferase
MVEIEGASQFCGASMKTHSTHGINDFVACLGYKGYVLKEYFANYFLQMSDVTFDMSKNSTPTHRQHCEPGRVTLDDEKISPWRVWT